MTIPILTLYLVGIVLFILGFEEAEDKTKSVIYLGLASFINYMGYTLSYQNTDFLNTAYLPLIMLIFCVVLGIYTAWNMIPKGKTWDEQTDED